jgi:hypothetical protein
VDGGCGGKGGNRKGREQQTQHFSFFFLAQIGTLNNFILFIF